MSGMTARRWELLTPEVLRPAGAQDQQGKVPATDEVIEPNHSCLLPNRPILTNALPERRVGRTGVCRYNCRPDRRSGGLDRNVLAYTVRRANTHLVQSLPFAPRVRWQTLHLTHWALSN